jgi:hypothetical protein
MNVYYDHCGYSDVSDSTESSSSDTSDSIEVRQLYRKEINIRDAAQEACDSYIKKKEGKISSSSICSMFSSPEILICANPCRIVSVVSCSLIFRRGSNIFTDGGDIVLKYRDGPVIATSSIDIKSNRDTFGYITSSNISCDLDAVVNKDIILTNTGSPFQSGNGKIKWAICYTKLRV